MGQELPTAPTTSKEPCHHPCVMCSIIPLTCHISAMCIACYFLHPKLIVLIFSRYVPFAMDLDAQIHVY
jgi:hypothetical protein